MDADCCLTEMKRPKTDNRFTSWVSRIGIEPFEKVGATPLDRLRWLVDFVQRPGLGHLAETDLEQAVREMAAFTIAEHSSPTYEAIDAAKLEDAAVRVRLGIEALASGDAWPLHLHGGMRLTVQLRYDSDGKLRRMFSGSLADSFVWQSQNVLDEARIRRCPVDGRLFVPSKRQEYCSSLCSQKMRNERFRDEHSPENRRKRRHNAYMQKIARENPALARHLAKSSEKGKSK